METKGKYLLLTGSVFLMFVLILLTEIPDRWSSTIGLFKQFQEKESQLASPEQLLEKRLSLMQKKRSLVSQLGNETMDFEDTAAGLYDFLNAIAQRSGLRLNSVVPEEGVNSAAIAEIRFEISARSRFHKIARFVNGIESGPFALRINRLQIEAEDDKTGDTTVGIEGVAYVSKKQQL